MLGSGFVSLGHRNYRLFWFGQVISLMGAWMQSVAQSWLILELTNSTFDVGIVVALQFGPILILGLFGGVLADRFNKRRMLMATQSLAALQALLLGILTWTGTVQPAHVMVLAALLGIVNSVDMPTRQSFVTEMVGKKDVMNAVALGTMAFNTARIIGPAIGGLVIAKVGTGPAFLVNAASFGAVIIGLALMKESELHRVERRSREGVFEGMKTGLVYVRDTPVVFVAVLLVGIVATFGMNFNVLLPSMARDDFQIGSEGFGILMSSIGIGALLAGLFVAFFPRLDPLRTMIVGASGFSILVGVFALSPRFPSLPLVIANLMAIGFFTILMTSMANTSIQRTSPDELRGRVMSVYVTIFAGTMPLGSLFAGGLATAFGAPVALVGGAALCGLAAIWARWRLTAVREEAKLRVDRAGEVA